MGVIRKRIEEAIEKDKELNGVSMGVEKRCNILKKRISIMKNYAVNIIEKSYKTAILGKPRYKK